MRAASFVDDVARWGAVTPLALDSQDYDMSFVNIFVNILVHIFVNILPWTVKIMSMMMSFVKIFTGKESIPGLLHGFHSYL